MTCLVEVGIDNNALSTWLDREGVGGVAERVRRQRVRLVVSDMHFTEAARGNDEATDRVIRLGELARELGEGFGMAEDIATQLGLERAGYRLRRTPLQRPNPLVRLLDMSRLEVTLWREALRDRLALSTGQAWWTSMLESAQTNVTPKNLALAVGWLDSLPEVVRTLYHPEGWFIDKFVPLERRGDGLGMRRRATADPWAFSTLAALHGMMISAAIAGGVKQDPKARTRSRWTVAMRTHKNDFADAQIVAASARCAFLVSDDECMRERMKLLGVAGMGFTIPVPLADIA